MTLDDIMSLEDYKSINGEQIENKKIILLGTCLGKESQKVKLPYMNKNNHFYDYFYGGKGIDNEKLDAIKKGKYLIFDIYKKGYDKNGKTTTKDREINYEKSKENDCISDFVEFKNYYKKAETIYFLGLKAFRSFLDIIHDKDSKTVKEYYNDFDFYVLPSTSGANNRMCPNKEEYLNEIKLAKQYCMHDLITDYKTLKKKTLNKINEKKD